MASKDDLNKFAEMGDDEVIEIEDDDDDQRLDDGQEDGEFDVQVGDELEIHLGDDGEDGEMDEEEEEEDVFDDALQVFEGHGREPVYAVVAAHANANLVVSGGGDDKSFVWTTDDANGRVTTQHGDSVVSVAFDSSDEWVASGGMDGIIFCKNLRNGKDLKLEGPGSEIEWIAWHPKHLVLLAGSADTTTWMFNIEQEGEMMGILVGHNDSVTCGAFTANGRRIITGSMDGTMKVWDPNGCSLVHTFAGHGFHEGGVLTLVQKADEPLIATGGSDGYVCLSRLDTKKIVTKLRHAEAPKVEAPRRVQHYEEDYDEGEEEEEEEEEQMEEEGCSIETLAFCPTLPWLVSGGTDGRIVIWDLAVQAKRSVLIHPGSDGEAIVRCLFLPKSVKLIAACADGKVRKYDARSSTLEKTLAGHSDAILSMALLADNKRVVTGSDDGSCRIFVVDE